MSRIGTLNLRIARERLGLRQSSGAFGRLASIAKAPEDWRSPKPGGTSDGSWKGPPRRHFWRALGPLTAEMGSLPR